MYLIPLEFEIPFNINIYMTFKYTIPGLIRNLLVSDISTLSLVRASSQFSVLPLTFGLLLITSLYLHCSEG